MRLGLLIILNLYFSISFSQNRRDWELGIGFIIPNDPYNLGGNNLPFNLYEDSLLVSNWNSSKGLSPYFNKPDYGLFHFLCLEKTNTYFKVRVNDSTIGYFKRDSLSIFKSWEEILVGSSVKPIFIENKVVIQPTDTSKVVDVFCYNIEVLDVFQNQSGYWLKIQAFNEEEEGEPNKVIGYLKWRDEKSVLIEIFLLC